MGDLVLVLGGTAFACVCAYVVGFVLSDRWLDRVGDRTRRASAEVAPSVADIAADVRRLRLRFHSLPPHTSYVKVAAVRDGYDRALADYCDATGTAHELLTTPDGPALDAERARIETLLPGLLVDPAA